MKLRLYQQIINQTAKEKRLKVLWLNKDGEPLLHPEIGKMIGYAKKKKVADRIEIYTNGLLLDRLTVEKLIKAKLDSLVVSLDAVNRESFLKLKKKDSYDQIVANIHRFLRKRRELKAKKPLLTVKMVDLGRRQEAEKFKKLWGGVADNVVIQLLHNWEGSVKEIFNFQFSIHQKRYPCNLPWLAPAINWDGKIVPCCVNFRENELMMGDLKIQNLAEVWQGGKFKKLRQAHLEQNFSQFPTCGRCQYWRQLPNMSFWLRRLGA